MKRWLEDYAVGESLVSHGRTISEADFLTYAGLEHDFASVHFDAQMMESSAFGQRIGAGFITLNLAVGLFAQGEWDWYWPEGAVRTEGWEDIRFVKPLLLGDTIRCRRTIEDIAPDDDGTGVLVHLVEMHNQGQELLMTGKERVRVRTHP